MNHAVETRDLSKRFGSVMALDRVTVAVPRGSIAGLIGRNGSGKTTLLHHWTGLLLPGSGESLTLGSPSGRLGAAELARIGVVHQEGRFLEWMTVYQHLRYVASFYPRWDRALEDRLLLELDLDPGKRVVTLSPGSAQKLALILAVGHHPDLLLLDEPASGLDPIAREQLLAFLLERVRDDGTTVLVSSHVLRDVERLVDWVVCLEGGLLRESAPLDDLKESFAEWVVSRPDRPLESPYTEPYVLRQDVNRHRGRLLVRAPSETAQAFAARHEVEVEVRPLNLEEMFPLLVEEGRR